MDDSKVSASNESTKFAAETEGRGHAKYDPRSAQQSVQIDLEPVAELEAAEPEAAARATRLRKSQGRPRCRFGLRCAAANFATGS